MPLVCPLFVPSSKVIPKLISLLFQNEQTSSLIVIASIELETFLPPFLYFPPPEQSFAHNLRKSALGVPIMIQEDLNRFQTCKPRSFYFIVVVAPQISEFEQRRYTIPALLPYIVNAYCSTYIFWMCLGKHIFRHQPWTVCKYWYM